MAKWLEKIREFLRPPLRQRDLIYLLPGAVLSLAALLVFHLVELPGEIRGFFNYYPFLVLVSGLLLGWRFNRTRLIFALLAFLLADLLLRRVGAGETPTAQVILAATGTLLPVNLVLVAFYRERGLFTPRGQSRIVLILLQPLLVVFLYSVVGTGLADALQAHWVEWPLLERLQLPQIAIYTGLLSFLVLARHFVVQSTIFEAGLCWAQFLTLTVLAAGVRGPQLTLWFATAGLILVVSLIETSHHMAYRDELTGLPSRRALNEELDKVGRAYCVAMVDVDHFKKVNDTYGHDVGDQVLKMVAVQLEGVGGGGRPFRYGGEEFTVLFPGKSIREALPHLEELRMAIEKSSFTLRGLERPKEKPDPPTREGAGSQTLRVTASIGAAERNQFNQSPAEVIKAADKALYRAKQQGRNQVVRSGARAAGTA